VLGACQMKNPAKQYGLAQILGLWVIATLPMLLLARAVIPALLPIVTAPAVLVYWLLLLVNVACQLTVSLWVIRREEGDLRWESIRRRIWLEALPPPKTGKSRPRFSGWLLLCLFVVLVALVLSVLLPTLFWHHSTWPSFAYITEVGSPEFAGQWWWFGVVLAIWGLNVVLAEELLFRGVLLPRMNGVFGRGDWLVNALLYGLSYLHIPIMMPFRFLEALAVAGPVRRFRSFRTGLIMRGCEGLVIAVL
jgi:membrane protease YdiL (CAAX protease family)